MTVLVFVHINKTAGTTLRYVLRNSYGSRHCDVEPRQGTWADAPFTSADLRLVRAVYPRLASIAGHRITGHVNLDADDEELRYFTFLRDPLRLCASRFQYQVEHGGKTDLVFADWIQREWLRDAQTKRIAGVARTEQAIRVIEQKEMFVGLVERFDESLVLLKALRAGDLDIDYTSANVAPRNTLARELLSDPSTREALVDANRADLELYAYARDELLPRFRREFGRGLGGAVAAHLSRSKRGWNRRRILASRVMQYGIYKPVLRLQRVRPRARAEKRRSEATRR